MSQETVTIGGRQFEVACQPGEEHYLRAAAQMLDAEATALIGQIGKLPESKMLLMAGLMLADKTAGAEDRARSLEGELSAARAEIERLRASSRERVEVPVVPQATLDKMADLAARAEALADQLESR